MKPPKDDAHYAWTHHVWEKMQFYGLSESRIKRVIRFPARTEEGIAPRTVAVMQSAGTSKYQEIWVMYKIQRQEKKDKDKKKPVRGGTANGREAEGYHGLALPREEPREGSGA